MRLCATMQLQLLALMWHHGEELFVKKSARVAMQIIQYSTAGKREYNEDTVFAEPTPPSGALLIIADGLGGHANGKVASELACDTVRRLVEQEDPATFVVGGHDLQKPELMQAFLYDVVRQANAMVWHEARQQGTDMQSTLLVVMLTPDTGYAGHVGDCALFVSGDGSSPVTKLTSEHRRGASLTRTLGADEQVTPDILSFPFNEQSALVMGCDGFWEHVPSDRVMRTLQDWPAFCVARELGRAALEAGSQDNVSVVVVTGDGFVTRYAANQMKTYASALALRGDDPDTISDRREFLAFCTRHVTVSSQTPSLMAQTLARIPDSRQYWEMLQPQLPPEIRQRVMYLMAPERPTSVELPTPLVSSPAGTPALESARPSESTAGPLAPARVGTDDISSYVNQLDQLIDVGKYFSACEQIKKLVVDHPGMRPTLIEWLRQHLINPNEAALPIQEEILWDEYRNLAPHDIDTACAFAEKLWYHSKPAAWRIFKAAYQRHPSHRERIARFMRNHGASEDSAIVGPFVEIAIQPDVRGPGIAWALKALHATAPIHARQLATNILRDWPPSQDTEEIRQWLHPSEPRTKPADSMVISTEGALDTLASLRQDIVRLKRDLATAESIRNQLREQLEEVNQLLGERERTIRSLQDRIQLFIDNTKILGLMMLKFRVEYPEQALKLWPENTWQSWEAYFADLGVRPPTRSVPQPESKRPWSRR